MKIKMKTLAAGPDGVFLEGKTYVSPNDLSDEKAKALVDGEYAVIHAEKPQAVETADAPVEEVEQAVETRPAPRTRTKPKKEK